MYTLITNHPIAVDSLDHIDPRGAKNDNTHCESFVIQCEKYFMMDRPLRFLDLGCSGGGLVVDFLNRGHSALGLEGSDYSLLRKRAEWGVQPDAFKTCDITKPFQIQTGGGVPAKFDVISAWEVLEHISPEDLLQTLYNIYVHLSPFGIFACSISDKPDVNDDGFPYHLTIKSLPWWLDLFAESRFTPIQEVPFKGRQWPRGPGSIWNDQGFQLVLKIM